MIRLRKTLRSASTAVIFERTIANVGRNANIGWDRAGQALSLDAVTALDLGPRQTEMLAKRPSKTIVRDDSSLRCAIGVYPGVRQFQNGGQVAGVFGMVGVFPECHEPVTARCQLLFKGQLTPYFWYACDNPDHRRDAGVIEHLDEQGRIVRISRFVKGQWQDDPPKLGPGSKQ
jgi:hypothetical protein